MSATLTIGRAYRVTWRPVIGRTWQTSRTLTLLKLSGSLLVFEDGSGRRTNVHARTVVKIRRARATET